MNGITALLFLRLSLSFLSNLIEKLGLIGNEKAIACEAIVSLNYYA